MKKVVIANNLYGPVNQVYSSVHDYKGLTLIIVLLVQAIYIYYDFSGYTDIVLGSAKLFNINIAENFNRPFLSKSVSEFWRRWHMSLSSWCNDFIYNPFIVKYRRYGNAAVISGIFLTFFVVGIWHGANWKFVALGLLQGIAIVYEFNTKRWRLAFASRFSKGVVNAISRLLVFLFVCITMVFFFSNSISDAWYFFTHLFYGIQISSKAFVFITDKPLFILSLCCFLLLYYLEILKENGKDLMVVFLKQHYLIQWAGYLICICLIYFFNNGLGSFYYMRF
jgi:D-alanyl-lipoteichoic acid acyltransferase DltB (MBOAT superfamily)